MLNPENKNRLKNIHSQLYEIANGNFSFQIERTNHIDELEALSALVNMVTEELKDSFLHEGYINFRNTYTHTTQTSLILDEHFKIIDCHEAISYLGFETSDLIGEPLEVLLADKSVKTWKAFKPQIHIKKSVLLSFKTKQNLIFKAQCFFIKFDTNGLLKNLTLLITFDLVQAHSSIKLNKNAFNIQPKKKKSNQILNAQDIESIREAGKFIIDHLENDLPKLKDLAHTFGINEFKLKKGFKQLYGMTVFQFLKTERLKKSHILVKHTKMSFKAISQTVGFKTPSHFSREFYNYYNYRPKTLRLNPNVSNSSH